jgi:hypothetical protein
MQITFTTYTSRNLASLQCETKDNVYSIDVYQSGAMQPRINYRNVEWMLFDTSHYARKLHAFAESQHAAIIAMLCDEEEASYRDKWWDIRNACKSA